MCGRYSLGLSNEEVYDGLEARLPQLFEQGRPRWEREQDHQPRYNVAPRQRAAVIRRDPDDGRAMIEEMQWGLIPHWTKHPPSGGLNTINARSEGLLDASSGGMWHALKGFKRCIIPAQGYYEWLKRPSSKVAHFTRHPLSPSDTPQNPPLIFFAGLYDIVKYQSPVESRFQPSEDPSDTRQSYPTGNPLPLATFTILTTTPSKDIEWLHDRMPCILERWEDVCRWLDLGEMKGWEEGKGGTGDLLKGFPGLDCYPVPPEVGKVGKESPTFIQPVSERSDGIKSFFNKQTTPAKSKGVKAEPTSPSRAVKAEPGSAAKAEAETRADPEGIKSEITSKDEEPGLGDDSNAPNPHPNPDTKPILEDTTSDIKDEKEEVKEKGEKGEKEDLSTTLTKRKRDEKGGAGQRTKVIRRDEDDSNKEQTSITNFFKSPKGKKEEILPPRRTSTRKKK